MADTGKTGGVVGASMNGKAKGWGWRTRTALANVLRVVPFFITMVLMVILWDACGGGLFPKVSSSSSATSTSTKTPGSGAFLYVTENATGLISQYNRNPVTGVLSKIGTPGTISAGNKNGPIGIGTASASSTSLYAVNSSTATDNVFQYGLSDVSGALTALSPASVSAGTTPQWIAVAPSSPYAYVTNFSSASVSQYTVASGVLTPNSPSTVFTGLSEPYGAAATDNFLFVTDQGDDDVVTFPIDNTNGTLQTPSFISLATGGVPGPIIIDTNGEFAFVTDTALGFVYAFGINGSGLTLIGTYFTANPGTDASVGLATVAIPAKSTEYLYIANPASNSITQYQVTAGTGVLTSVQQYTNFPLNKPWGAVAATDTNSTTIQNSYLYVTNEGNGTISVFSIDQSSGSLTLKSTIGTSGSSSEPLFPIIAF